MTRLECLKKMIKLWGYLADNPRESKEGAYQTLNLEPDDQDCPCCQYVIERSDQDSYGKPIRASHLCPLVNVWPGGYCANYGSVWRKWRDSIKDTPRTDAANAIRFASIKELNKLEELLCHE